MTDIRWGIVGPGNIANKFAAAIKNVDGAYLAGVASRSVESGKAFAEKYNIPYVFHGYESMAESDLIDAVYIATPHPFHKPCAEIFLNAKKHVLCEKPLCINAKEASELKECANRNGVFLMEAMWTRFLPAVLEAKRMAEEGVIGEIRGLTADFCYHSSPEEEEKLFRNDMAGGSLLDVGVYGLHFAAMFLQNEPDNISATADVRNGVDYHTYAVLKYPDNEIAAVTSAIGLKKPESAYIYGTKGYIFFPCFYGAREFYVYTNDGERNFQIPPVGDGFEEEIYEAVSYIRKGKTESDILPLSESIRILRQMDDIRAQLGVRYPSEY